MPLTSSSITAFARRPRRFRRALAYAVWIAFALTCLAILAWAFRQVWREAGALVAVIMAMSMTSCLLAGLHSLRWLRGSKVLITSALTISGTFLTLVLGYQLEHPFTASADKRFAGWVLIATGIAFVGSVVSEIRMQRLESLEDAVRQQQESVREEARRREEAEREQRAIERHAELMGALARARAADADPPRTRTGLRVDRLAHQLRSIRRRAMTSMPTSSEPWREARLDTGERVDMR